MTKCLFVAALLLVAILSSCTTGKNNSSHYVAPVTTSGTGQPVEIVHTY